LRAQIEVLITASGLGHLAAAGLDVSKLLGKEDAGDQRSTGVLPDQLNGIVERLADVEKLVARTGRQLKEAQSRERKAKLIAEAQQRALTKSIEKVVRELGEATERLRAVEHGVVTAAGAAS
jgi:hypothetical protein